MSKRDRKSPARNVAYAAVATALSLAMIFLTAYLPVSVLPLLVCALSWNIVIDKCGIGLGITSILATVSLGFLTAIGAGLGVMIIIGIVFVPYSLIAHFMKPLTYATAKHVAVRMAVLIVFAVLAFMGLFLAASAIAGIIDIAAVIERLSGGNTVLGCTVLCISAAIIVILIDFMYYNMRLYIVKRLK